MHLAMRSVKSRLSRIDVVGSISCSDIVKTRDFFHKVEKVDEQKIYVRECVLQ